VLTLFSNFLAPRSSILNRAERRWVTKAGFTGHEVKGEEGWEESGLREWRHKERERREWRAL